MENSTEVHIFFTKIESLLLAFLSILYFSSFSPYTHIIVFSDILTFFWTMLYNL